MKVLGLAHLLYYTWNKQRDTFCWIHQGRLDFSMKICAGFLVHCVNSYNFICLLFKHFQLLLSLKFKRKYVVFQIIVQLSSYIFEPISVFSPWGLYTKIMLKPSVATFTPLKIWKCYHLDAGVSCNLLSVSYKIL